MDSLFFLPSTSVITFTGRSRMDVWDLIGTINDVPLLLVRVASEFGLPFPAPIIRLVVETLAFDTVVVIVLVRPRIRTVSIGIL